MKKILLLGIFDSTYIVHFINDILIPLEYEVYIMPDTKDINNKFIDNPHLHIVYSLKKNSKNPILRKLSSIKKVFSDIKTLKKIGGFDFIHIHYVSYKALFIASKIKKHCNSKLLLTYWGSDILRDVDNEINKNRKYLKNVDYFSSDSLTTKLAFNKTYSNKYDLEVVYFGDSICTEIDKLNRNSVLDYKKEFNIPENKTIVTIGYNARPAQQHLQVINALINSKLNFEDFYFILPMTYCKEDLVYIENLKNTLKTNNLNHLIFESYLSDTQIGKLRLISDIFINAQTTDAFCNTVKEFFYLGKTIFNPTWLDYPEFKEWDLKTISYSDFSELPSKLIHYSEILSEEQLNSNSNFFKNKMSWENCKDAWGKIYNSL